jgi:hypothetical protein
MFWLYLIMRFFLGCVFVVMAVSKISVLKRPTLGGSIFEDWAANYPALGYGLIVIEIALGLWLLSGLVIRKAAWTTIILLVLFSGFIATEIVRKNPRTCGCAVPVIPGQPPRSIRKELALSLARNIVLIAGAGWLIVVGSASTERSQKGAETLG